MVEESLDTSELFKDEDRPRTWQETIRLIIPHVGLMMITILYAFVGAVVFYLVEHPNEFVVRQVAFDEIKAAKVALIEQMRISREMGLPEHLWKAEVSAKIHKLTEALHSASKSYVNPTSLAEHFSHPDEKPKKVWTISSALSFAFTTMATIGYGNVTPLTPSGRMVCVMFGLIGTPLAIIAIADLGKFFSECLISAYMKLNQLRITPQLLWRRIGGKFTFLKKRFAKHDNDEDEEPEREKAHVPVSLVLSAFFTYMMLGTVLFAYMENWGWMDSFYFCFITLTTIGFGDLVPDAQNKDLAIMLAYILVGLSLTTMCIDLVALRYIEQIHQAGQKVRRPDLKGLLHRRRKRARLIHISITETPTDANNAVITMETPLTPPIPPWPIRYNAEIPDDESTVSEISTEVLFYDELDSFESDKIYKERHHFQSSINETLLLAVMFIQPIIIEIEDIRLIEDLDNLEITVTHILMVYSPQPHLTICLAECSYEQHTHKVHQSVLQIQQLHLKLQLRSNLDTL